MENVEIDSRIDWVAFYTERLPTKPTPAGDHKYHACCPFHQETNPSFWFNTKNGLWKCEAGCGSGNATSFLARLEGVETREAYRELRDIAGANTMDRPKEAVRLPLSLQEYSDQKRLPMDFLKGLRLKDAVDGYGPAHVAIPYFDTDNACSAVKRRYNPENKQRFGWDKGGRIIPYGVWLDLNRDAKALVLVEGESDAQSLWLNHVAALGIPGAGNFQKEWVKPYIGERPVYLHIEPGKSGEVFRQKTVQALREGGFASTAFAFRCADADPECKDPSDLHIRSGEAFRERFDPLIKAAEPINYTDEPAIRQAVELPKPGNVKKQVHQLETYHVSDLYGKRLDRPPIIVQGLIPAGLTILAGAPKRGKSWLSLKLALDVAAGNPFLGMPTTQGDVLYLDLESRQYRIQERVGKLIAGKAPEALQACHMADRLDEDLLEQLRLWASGVERPVLIIIDTLGRVKGGARRGENSYESDTRILGELQSFALQNRLAVVCVHHLRKSLGEGDYFERISGSMGISGACDSVMVLQGKRGDMESVLSVSSRDFEPMELVLNFKAGVWSLVSTDSEAYRQEQEYLNSQATRNVVKLMARVDRWEGTPAALLEELLSIGAMPDGCTATQMSKELLVNQEMLCQRDGVLVNWKRTGKKGRQVMIQKVSTGCF